MEGQYISLALLPGREDREALIACSASICSKAGSEFQLGDRVLPHITVARFNAPEAECELLLQEVSGLKDLVRSLLSGGICFVPDPVQNKTWVELQFLKSDDLSKLQREISRTKFAQEFPLHNKRGGAYKPHCTLALLNGKIIPSLDIAPFKIFRRNFKDMQLSLGINGENLTLLSAQPVAGYTIPEMALRKQAAQDSITHLSTGIAIVKDGKILAVRREPADHLGGNFELPGGGVDSGETFPEAVKREVFEETGLSVRRIVGVFPGFEYSTPKKPKVRQFNFLVEVDDSDVVLSDEHDQWQWVGLDDFTKLPMSAEMKKCFELAFSKF